MSENPTIQAQIQAILFVSGEPVAKSRLAKTLSATRKEVDEALSELKKDLEENAASGLMLIEKNDAVELATKKGFASILEELTKSTLQERLSQAALEVLAIVAYRAPITRSHIEAIRGVNCSFTLRNLLLRGLIERTGNPEDAREYVYAPSFAFLEKLGLGSIQDLPQFAELSQDSRLSVVLENDTEAEVQKQNLSS